MTIPDYIIHYSRSEPFRSMTSLSVEERSKILKDLNETNAWGLARFSDPDYLKQRIIVERDIRSKFIAKGGKPILEHPIYFFLGRKASFEEHEKNIGYKIFLKDIPEDSISFTYGDSMFSMIEDYRRQKAGGYLSELCSKVYKLNELSELVLHSDYQASSRLHIEAQLWVKPTYMQNLRLS